MESRLGRLINLNNRVAQQRSTVIKSNQSRGGGVCEEVKVEGGVLRGSRRAQ